MKVIAYKEDMVLETNGICVEGMDIEKLRFTFQAIPLNKVLQAREEIQGNYEGGNHADEYIDGYNDGLLECLSILDKLIAESEGVND